ncbi:hypothetical protein [Kosmotoga olearia]|uniref:Uncharacterized protein n=1 Tax=Kosmotoga olearia (strain ATCC BAA-1733 / DSM 21960 / TBF 19.5.1) TaxID=521045 RepID=C5CFI1_KOSOT|nr:hypothetical protein [Kosmotoga olearia]ACR79399.1 hypothetical protein Kole_0683 [Kosmotoga olearia TBF 19.5.1]
MAVYLLPETLDVDSDFMKMVSEDYERFGDEGMPFMLEEYILQKFRIDLSATFAGVKIKNPFGKASGQLSMNIKQVKDDITAGIGFVVLKTVIAQDEAGSSAMEEWKVSRPRMKVERIRSRSGREGWSVTWKGRGWDKSFEEYLEFYKEAYSLGNANGIPVAASSQFHLPEVDEEFRREEYQYTGQQIVNAYLSVKGNLPCILEIDFSPTVNLNPGAEDEKNVLRWFREVPRLIRKVVGKQTILGVKIFNTIRGSEFQKKILKELLNSHDEIDYLTCFNRLLDKEKGMTYGGYDLSDTNLYILDSLKNEILKARERGLTISATGNICSGKMMIEYALRGATNGQCHTFFQLPLEEYRMKRGNRSERALHKLLFHPEEGLLVAMKWLEEKGYLFRVDDLLRFLDIFDHSIERSCSDDN